MNEEAEVGPYLVNVLYFIMFDHHFHTHLAPCRYANNIADIPLSRMLNDLVQFLIPVGQCRNPATGFIKTLEPERSFFGKYTAKIACIPARISFFKVRCTADH